MEEKNENSPGYTKKTIKQRLDNKYMSTLKYPATSTDWNDTQSKLQDIRLFYSKLYSSERIDTTSVDDMLSQVSEVMTKEESDQIIVVISFEDILEGASRSPKFSSLGMNSLPYKILKVILSHPRRERIITNEFNDTIMMEDCIKIKFPSFLQNKTVCYLSSWLF